MPLLARLCLTVLLAAGALMAPTGGAQAQAGRQNGWQEAALLGGAVVLRFDGSILRRSADESGETLAFWRPVLFKGQDPWPVAGRMDCDVAVRDLPFSEAAFDLDARYAEWEDQRDRIGFGEQHRTRSYSDASRRLDVVGLRLRPHEHRVYSLIALRHGARLYDILMNCAFRHGEDAEKADFAALVYRYTSVSLAEDLPTPDWKTEA